MRTILRVLVALALLGPLSTSAFAITASRTVRVPLEDGVVATLSEDRGILVEAVPRRGEGLSTFAQRLCGDGRLAPQVAEANGGAQSLLIPYVQTAEEAQAAVGAIRYPPDGVRGAHRRRRFR